MNSHSDPESSQQKEHDFAQLTEYERSNEITAPMSLDLENLPLNYQLPRYLIPTNCTGFEEHVCSTLIYGIDCDSCSLLDSIKESNNATVIKRVEAFSANKEENANEDGQCQLTKPKKKRAYNRKVLKTSSRMPEEQSHQGFSSRIANDDMSREEFQLKKGKSFSEPTTTELSAILENVNFPGLSGSQPSFRKSVCSSCHQNKMVFWFGDSSIKRRADKFLCAECIRSAVGEERFISLFEIDSDWPFKSACELSERKNWHSLKEYVQKAPIGDPQVVSINYLLEEKKFSVNKSIARMSLRLEMVRNKGDLETLFLCLRFIHELIDDLNRICHLLPLKSFEEKLNCMNEEERCFFQSETQRMESLVLALQTEVVKVQESERIKRHIQQGQNVSSVQRLGFALDFDDPSSLGKREPLFKTVEGFAEFEELEYEGYKINTHNLDYLMSQF